MSEDIYQIIKEEIEILTPVVRMNEMNTFMHQLNSGKISRDVAISKIYLENTQKPPKRGKYKKHLKSE
jgi:hypothetical protein